VERRRRQHRIVCESGPRCNNIKYILHVCLKFYGRTRSRRRARSPDQGTARCRRTSLRHVSALDKSIQSVPRVLDDERANMDSSSHLSLIVDLSPSQWHLSAHSDLHPLSFQTFLSHVLTLLNSHIAAKHENSLAVFGALPGKRWALPHKLVAAPSTDSVISARCSTPP
jgi:hypothetical protein